MPVTVRLDEQTEKMLDRIARERGLTRSEVIRRGIGLVAMEAGLDEDAVTLIQRLRPLVGSIRSGRADLSENTGKKMRERLRRSNGK